MLPDGAGGGCKFIASAKERLGLQFPVIIPGIGQGNGEF